MSDIHTLKTKIELVEIANANPNLLNVLSAINAEHVVTTILACPYVAGSDASYNECVELQLLIVADQLNWEQLNHTITKVIPEYNPNVDYSQFGFDLTPISATNIKQYNGFIDITREIMYG